MHGNGLFRNLQGGRKHFRASKITENMHFITTKCIVTLKCMRDVSSHTVLYIGPPVVLTLHSRPTHADKIIQYWMCVYIARLQL